MVWTRDWSKMDWEQFAEEVIEPGAGKRTVEEMSLSEDDLMELQIWAATVDYLYQVKLDLVMFFGKEPGNNKEKNHVLYGPSGRGRGICKQLYD